MMDLYNEKQLLSPQDFSRYLKIKQDQISYQVLQMINRFQVGRLILPSPHQYLTGLCLNSYWGWSPGSSAISPLFPLPLSLRIGAVFLTPFSAPFTLLFSLSRLSVIFSYLIFLTDRSKMENHSISYSLQTSAIHFILFYFCIYFPSPAPPFINMLSFFSFILLSCFSFLTLYLIICFLFFSSSSFLPTVLFHNPQFPSLHVLLLFLPPFLFSNLFFFLHLITLSRFLLFIPNLLFFFFFPLWFSPLSLSSSYDGPYIYQTA